MKKQISKLLLGCALIAFSIGSCTKDNGTPPDNKPDIKDTTPKEPAFLADSTPKTRVAVLEDFTGVRCQYCPDGHDRAKAIEADYGDRFITIANHSGGYAAPQTGWNNFTTKYGEAIDRQAAPLGYPAGTINRLVFEDYLQTSGTYVSKMAMNRNNWRAAAEEAMGMPAPVNLGAKAIFDEATRKLTVRVDIYYTADETVANNLNVAILQDNLLSRQSNTNGINRDYPQHNVLRDYLTGQWGEVITEAKTKGAKITKTYVYDVPADYNGTGPSGGGAVVIDDLKVVAFVARGRKDITNAVEVDVK